MASKPLLSNVSNFDLSYPTVLLALSFGILYWLATNSKPTGHRFTRLGKPWILQMMPGQVSMTWTIDKYVEEGYYKIHKSLNHPFTMKWWAKEYTFLPPKYLPDFKRADSQSLSFFKNISDAFSLGSSVGDLYTSNVMIDVVNKRLNPQLPLLVPVLANECNYAFGVELGDGNEWKDLNAAKIFSKIMHRVTSRVLAGEELCRNNDYLDVSMEFSESIFVNGMFLSMIPLGPLRPFGSWIGSFRHRRKLEKALKVVLPVVEQHLDRKASDPKPSSNPNAIDWTIELATSLPKENNPRRIALHVLHNLWAGSAATGGLVTQMVFQLLMEPKYLSPLVAEIDKAVSTHGWSEKSLNNMPLLDSYIREINRLYPTGSVTCARTIMNEPFRFHDGLVLPAGSCIAIPAMAIQQDPANFANSLVFDGFRFTRQQRDGAGKRAEGEEEQTWSAATVSTTNLAFGYGKHACPGRFYAVRKAKIIFGMLLMDYDIRWAGKGVVLKRPPSLSVNGQFAPNLEQSIQVRRKAQGRR